MQNKLTGTARLYATSLAVAMLLAITACVSGAASQEALATQPVAATQTPVPDAQMVTAPTTEPSATPSPLPTPDANLPLSDIAYTVPITTRHVTTSGATLFFELSAPSAGRVFVSPQYGSGAIVERALAPSETRHLLTFDGLAPGTLYQAIVALDGPDQVQAQPQFMSRVWGPVKFTTAAEDGPIRVGVIGDASFGDPSTTALVGQMAAADLDFVLHAGDVVDETEQGVNPFDAYARKFYTPFEPLLKQMPIYAVIGNHDYDRDIRWQDEPFYYHAFPPFPDPDFPNQGDNQRNQYYAFARQGIQFVMLDTHVFAGASGRAEELAWLKERLADPRYRATIPVLHVPPLNSSSVHPDDSLPIRYDWLPLFENANVPLTFSGHYHHYERLAANGVTYIISGGGSSTLYVPGERIPESQMLRRQTHFVLMEINGTQIRLTAIALGGETIEQVEIIIQPPRS